MALTPTQQAWIETDNLRAVLVEAAYDIATTGLYCNNGNTNPNIPYDIFCNNGNTDSSIPPIYCNSTSISQGEEVIYLSNTPYITENAGSFTNVIDYVVNDISYDDALKDIPAINSTIEASTTLGNISFYNESGQYDALIEKAFEGHKIKILMGDISWNRSDFITVFNGRISTFTAPDISTLSFSIRDKKEILEKTKESTTITASLVSSVLASATEFIATVDYVPTVIEPDHPWASIAFNPNIQSLPEGIENTKVPICVGKCFNVEPVLIDAYNHVFMIHNGPITGVSSVKSDGIELDPLTQYEVDEAIGCIRLLDHQQTTTITADVEGALNRGYGYDADESLTKNSVPWLIEWLVLEKTELLSSDIDYASFTAVDTANPSEVGIFYRLDDESILSLMTQITSSIGSFYRFNRLGTLELTILVDPLDLPTPDTTLVADDLEHNGLNLSNIELPTNQVNLSYQKNWTVLNSGNLAGILLEIDGLADRDVLTSEYQVVDAVNAEVKAAYPLAEVSDIIETLIYTEANAQTEVDRRADIRSQKRFIYKLKSVRPMLDLDVGDTITIIHDRFGFTSPGKPAIIIGLSERLTNNRVDIEAWL